MILYIVFAVITIGGGGFVFGSGVEMQKDNSWSTQDGYSVLRGWSVNVLYLLITGLLSITQGVFLILAASQC